ncbi:MAG: VWA domain-containing protein [bacterium]|nr:VWA domain-containing protein [bacterium]
MFPQLFLEHPWWLILLIPLVIGIGVRISSTYFLKAHSHIAPIFLRKWHRLRKIGRRIALALPIWIKVLTLILIITALVDVTRGYVIVLGQKVTQRIIVNLDVSSSMYGFGSPLSTITCKQNSILFPRIRGACRALYRLVDDVEKETRGEVRPRVTLSLLQFASRSAVVSYPTTDYVRFREKVDRLEFKDHGLGASTSMHLALWDMFLMALERNRKKDSGFTNLTGYDLQKIYAALAPGPRTSPLYIPQDLAKKLSQIKIEMRDTVFMVPTDAVVFYLQFKMDSQHPSIRRLMQLAEFLEIPVYFLSTDEHYPDLQRLARRTGFGPLGGPHRGEFLMVRKEQDEYLIEGLVTKILASRFNITIPTYETRRESYTDLMLELALTLAVFGVLWKKFVARSLTDLE